MNSFLINTYKYFGKLYRKIKLYSKVNWIKTLYFNFKVFPFNIAKKTPVFIYGKVKIRKITGKVNIEAPIKQGMIGFGQSYEIITNSKGIAEIFIEGRLTFKGYVQFGKDYFIYISKNANCEMGNMSSLGNSGKIICIEKIILGEYCRIGFESQLIDTSAHQMINTETLERIIMTTPIIMGDYNYVGNRVSIMKGTKTPKYTTITSNSLCNKDLTFLGEKIMIGGIPAKLIKNNISRDWDGEREIMKKWLKVN